MEYTFWQKQTDKPLFPELEWSRPENKTYAGKLLLIGGSSLGFASVAEAYGSAEKAGAGTVRVLLPDRLQKTVSKLFPAAEFALSNPSGGFSQLAMADLVDASVWADGVLLAGDTGRNSETAVVLENFLEKYEGQATITKDAADLFCVQPFSILQRPDTLLVISMGQLQKLGTNAKFARAFTSTMGLVQLVEALHEFTKRFTPYIITRHADQFIVAVNGQVSTTKCPADHPIWRVQTAASASVWWLQTPGKPFEALTTSVTKRPV
ncbi:hypothetical protein EYC59_01155 [Candidatus Saccharibacteria bacterium]|nr:MAG: hypothetical protein EYC59_01155 [Candidatus Saccharibacteria bacterium]